MAADHVLVKGEPYTETIDAVYGPYTKEHAEWLADQLSDGDRAEHWKVKPLLTLDQPVAEQPAQPSEREINCTACSAERAWSPVSRRPVTPIGFALPTST